jgi:L-ascorbate metabolism protein UlaG (beta-lactamase superfamily)
MKIKWYGHSAFGLTSELGVRVIMDPFTPNAYDGELRYSAITDAADIVTTSHDHPDHNWVQGIAGKPLIVKTPCAQVIKGVKIEGIPAYHDKSRGAERGGIRVYKIGIDGIRVCHLGDLGHMLPDKDIQYLKPIDVLMVPVGGHFTIDAVEAWAIVKLLQPKIILPMHMKTDKCGFPLTTVDVFTKDKEKVIQVDASEIELFRGKLPTTTEVWVMKYAN